MKIYCISGLGADERAFKNLRIPGHSLIFIQWIRPQKNEDLANYVDRLKVQIDMSESFALLGVSFGGIVALELSQIVPARQVFIISSFTNYFSLPRFTRLLITLGSKIKVPGDIPDKFSFLIIYFFGAQSKEGRQTLKQIISDTDPEFVQWALSAISYQRFFKAISCIRIHGTNDRIIPLKGKVDYIIKGGHWIIYEEADKISEIVSSKLNI